MLTGLLALGFGLGWMEFLPRSLFGSAMVFEFLGGAVIAYALPALQHLISHKLAPALIVVGVAAICASGLLASPVEMRVLIWGPAGAILVIGCVLSNWTPKGWLGRFLVFLGTASYSIYISQSFFVSGVEAMLKMGIGQDIQPDLLILICALAAVVVCSTFYPVLERPLLRWMRPSRPTPALI